MNTTCATGIRCWGLCVGYFIIWWLLASALLMVTWNKVIGTIAKAKAIKYWHALVFLLTLCFVFVIPKMCMSRYAHHYGMMGSMHKGDCPYAADKDEEKPEAKTKR